MNQHFFHIATINASHQYTGEIPFNGLTFTLTPQSQILARNLSVIFKIFPGGVHILAAEPELLSGEDSKLILEIFASSPLFYNYTDFEREFRPDLHVFSFSIDSGQTESKYLHRSDVVSFADAAEVIQKSTLMDLQNRIQQGEARLFNSENEEVLISEFHQFFSSGQGSVVYVEEQGERKMLYKPSSMRKNPFGVVSLDCEQLFNAYTSSDGPAIYSIHFKSKKTVWRYILSSPVYDNYHRLAIIDTQDVNFQFHESELEIQDRSMKSFETQTALPFVKNDLPRFQLVERINGGQGLKVVVKQLPKASPESFHKKASNDDTLVSHIFI